MRTDVLILFCLFVSRNRQNKKFIFPIAYPLSNLQRYNNSFYSEIQVTYNYETTNKGK